MDRPDILVRDALPEDLETIVEFNRLLAEESESKLLDRQVLRPGVAALLTDRHKGRYFMAESQGRPVGQLMVTYEWSDWRNGNIWWLQSVYVVADLRRGGVFRRLMAHVDAALAADPEAIGLRLYVDSDNHSAQATYRNLGFESGNYRVMERLAK